jgi:tetratricopeptide (TPR) repeat protein
MLLVAGLCGTPWNGYAKQTGTDERADPAAANVMSGLKLLQRKEFSAAKLQFSLAVKANPNSADALTWRGIAENELKQFHEAERDFDAALRIRPDDVPAHYNLALSLIRLGENDRAVGELREVVKLQPGAPEPEYNLAILLEEKHATSEAIEHLEVAFKARPDDAAVMQHLAIDLLAAGRGPEAQPVLEQMLNMHSPEALRQVSTALLKAGDGREAIPLLESLRAQSQASAEVDMLLARAYIAAQEDSKAIQLLSAIADTDHSGEAAFLLGLAFLDTGSAMDAKDAFERSLNRDPRNGTALYHLGLLESAVPEQLPRAVTHLQAAVKAEPENARFSIALARVLLEQDDARGAMLQLERIHATGPEEGERDLLLGIAQIIVSGPAQAVQALERAVAESPTLALSHNMLGFCYFAQGDMSKAASSYGQASDLSPGTRLFAHSAAVAYDRANNAERATVYAARAASLSEAKAEDHDLYGKLLAKGGRKEDAIRELKEAIALNPNLEEAYYQLGRTYLQAGDSVQAGEWMDKLKQLKQSHRDGDNSGKEGAKPMASSTLLQGAPSVGPDAP